MSRRIRTKKTSKFNSSPKYQRKDLRFDLSLVILIGMLSFSLLLLLFSLNRPSTVRADIDAYVPPQPVINRTVLKKPTTQTIVDNSLDFKLTVPTQMGEWFYKIGEVKSLIDDSLSNKYLQIFVPLPGANSNNFNEQNVNILTIRRFSLREWKETGKDCPDGKICKASGDMIVKAADSSGNEWVWAYTKPTDCPKNIEAKCLLADKIVQSFQLK